MSMASKLRWVFARRASLRTVLRKSSVTVSQYGEDVIFDRLLRPGPRGTYVDVGANHPVDGSNTFRLYAKGWNGLAIDPNPAFAALYRQHRPRDIWLTAGVSATPGTLTYHEFATSVFNTFDPAQVTHLVSEGRQVVGRIEVACRPLSAIVDEMLPDRQIDLLNIDCEGMDLEVLRSLDLSVRRPTVLILEDYKRYRAFQDGTAEGAFDHAIRELGYAPIAQSAWSAIFVARDWQRLFKLSDAFDERRVLNGYMP